MRNKLCTFLLAGTVALFCTSCGGNAQKQTANDTLTDSVTNSFMNTLQLEGGVKVTSIHDVTNSHPRTLFPDADDALIDSLSLQDGIPSSISTFLVETNGVRILFDTGLGQRRVVCLKGYRHWASFLRTSATCISPISMVTTSVA